MAAVLLWKIMSLNNIIPYDLWFSQTPCKVCRHLASHHRDDVGCIGVFTEKEDKKSFYMGTCRFACKKYCETNLDYLEYMYEQHNNK
jgi:hypothetical protein